MRDTGAGTDEELSLWWYSNLDQKMEEVYMGPMSVSWSGLVARGRYLGDLAAWREGCKD